MSRVNRVSQEGDEGPALTALRSHVLNSADGVHGPAGDYPEDADPEDLAVHVVFTG